jgi:DMSO/TMAO reductase YedYZ heme-binding membrane subunit
MRLTREGAVLTLLIVLLFVAVGIVALTSTAYYATPLGTLIRLCGLYGFLMIAIALMLTSSPGTVYRTFGAPFLRVHHLFAAFGIALITVHPVSFAVLVMTPRVFIPTFQSWIDFWVNAGRVALILLYIALIGVFLRKRLIRWRYLHAMMYLVLFFAVIHANLIGTDFLNPFIRVVYDGLFAGVILVFAISLRRKLRSRRPAAAKKE